MKLTKTQEAVYKEMLADIDMARSQTFEEYVKTRTPKCYWEAAFKENSGHRKMYEQKRSGVVSTYKVNSRTLKALEKAGLIEILFDSNGRHFSTDEVKVLNY